MRRYRAMALTACTLLLSAGCGSADNDINTGSPTPSSETAVPAQSVPDAEVPSQPEDDASAEIDWGAVVSRPNPYTSDGAGGSLCWAASELGRLAMTVQMVPEKYDSAALAAIVPEMRAQLERARTSNVMEDPTAAQMLNSSSNVVDNLANAVQQGATSADQIFEVMKGFETPSTNTGFQCS